MVELTRLVKTYVDPLTGQSVSKIIYGLQGLSSDHPVVLMLVDELTRLLKTYKGPITGQAVGNMLLGLKSIKSDKDEVLVLMPIPVSGSTYFFTSLVNSSTNISGRVD